MKNTESKSWGMAARFKDPTELLKAAKSMCDAGYEKYDAHSPFPVHGMDGAMKLKETPLGVIVLTAAIIGCIFVFGFQAWVGKFAYPLIISNKPLITHVALIPVTFALTILTAAFTTVGGLFFLNRMPQWYHPLFKHSTFGDFSNDGFFISVSAEDNKYSETETRAFLESLGGTEIETVEE